MTGAVPQLLLEMCAPGAGEAGGCASEERGGRRGSPQREVSWRLLFPSLFDLSALSEVLYDSSKLNVFRTVGIFIACF